MQALPNIHRQNVLVKLLLLLLLFSIVSSQSPLVDLFKQWEAKRGGKKTPDAYRPESCQDRLNQAATSILNPKSFLAEIGLLLETYYNWGELLAPAPVAIGILGQLTLMSNQRMDFPININPPRLGFKHIEYPKSFRTTLLQISQRGNLAFLKAHTNMNAIQLYNRNIPVNVEDAVRFLKSKNQRIISLRLIPKLNKIKEAADRSKELSEEIVRQFQLALDLIQETILAVTATKIGNKENFKKVQRKLNATIAAEAFSKNETERLETKNDNIDKMLRRFEKRQQDLYLKITYPECGQYADSFNQHSAPVGQTEERKKATEGRRHPELVFQAGNWHYTFETNLWNADDCLEKNSQNLVQLLTAAKHYKMMCDTLQNEMKNNTMLSVINFEVSEELQRFDYTCNAIDNCPTLKRLFGTCKQLVNVVRNANRNSLRKTDPCPGIDDMAEMLHLIAEHRAAKIKDVYKEKTIVLDNIEDIKDAYLYVQRHQKQMLDDIGKTAKTMIELNNKNLMENHWRMKNILMDGNQWDSASLTYQEAIEVLENSLSQLVELKSSWDKLVEFFTRIGSLTNKVTEASYSFIYFTSPYSTTTKKDDEVSFYDDLINHAEKANAASLLVADLASIYVTVSDRYIMDRLNSLARLRSVDIKAIGRSGIEKEKKSLSDDSMKAYNDIMQMMKEEEEKMLEKLRNRRRELLGDYTRLERECLPAMQSTTQPSVTTRTTNGLGTVKPKPSDLMPPDEDVIHTDDYEETDEFFW